MKTDTAFDRLRRDILNGTHRPGAPLRLAALTARYGVSASPLREALSRLEEKQLVVAEPNKGWRVAPVSLAEFEDLQSARLVLESRLLEDAMAQGGLEWESGIVAAHYRLSQVTPPLGADDIQPVRQRWIETHDAFHNALLAAARSDWLKTFHAQALEQLHRHHQALLLHGERPAQPPRSAPPSGGAAEALRRMALSVPRHTALMQAVLDRDRAAALATLREHVETTRAIYRAGLGDGFSAAPQQDR